jgi:hypothetical protein
MDMQINVAHTCLLKEPRLGDSGPERKERQLREFETLNSERNTYNRYTVNDTQDESRYSKFPSEKQYPQKIEKHTTRFDIRIRDFFSERPEYQIRDFEALNTKWNKNDGDAE